MIVATNRNVVWDNFHNHIGNENGFGERVNEKGPNELRFARAERNNAGGWQLELVPEPDVLTPDALPSKMVFKTLATQCVTSGKNCVFYVHGYNKPFQETLEQGWLIQERYGVEVVLFSWPSNTGGIPPVEYREARRNAQASFGALDALLEKYARYLQDWLNPMDEARLLECETTTNLIAHSLGNYLLEHYVLSQAYQAETRLFTNIVLSQADVNNSDHSKWTDQVVVGQRIYATINEHDKILGWSETLNPPRLGKTLANLNSKKLQYYDFTQGKNVGNKHQLWGEVDNPAVKAFFDATLNGRRADTVQGFVFDQTVNAYRIQH